MLPARSGVSSVLDGPGPDPDLLLLMMTFPRAAPRGNVKHEPVDNVPVEIDAHTDHVGERSYQVRPVSRRRGPRSTLHPQDTNRVQTYAGSDPGPVFEPNATVARVRHPKFQHRDL